MRCPQCQIENAAAAKFCRSCGTRLFAVPPPPPDAMAPTPCANCQAPMPPGVRFCRACGKPRATSSAPGAPVPPVAPPLAAQSRPSAPPPPPPQFAPPPPPPPPPPGAVPASAAPISAARLSEAKLVSTLGALQGMSFRVGTGNGVIIGRSPGTDVRVPDPEVSKTHCWVGVSNQRLVVRDLKSTNGTYLNDRLDQPVTECELREGDVIVLGRHNGAKFRVWFGD